MTYTPKKIDAKTSEQEVLAWSKISQKKEKEYIPYPFENWIKENLDWGESFNITKEDWFDHINEIRRKEKKPPTKAGPSIFMMMKSKVDGDMSKGDEPCRYNTIQITKWIDEETKEHLGWKIRRLYYPHVEDEKTIRKREEKERRAKEIEEEIKRNEVDVKGPGDVVKVMSKNGRKKTAGKK